MVVRARKPRRGQTLGDQLDNLSETLSEQHTEIVQRLTALETTVKGLPERVSLLETNRGKIAGGLAVLTFIVTSAIYLLTSLTSVFKKH